MDVRFERLIATDITERIKEEIVARGGSLEPGGSCIVRADFS
jgi:hypothetical protein